MAILAIVQARMSSSRLPGKVLMDIEGIPMIGRQIERVRKAHLISEVIVATSVHASDDPLVDYLESIDVKVQRGPLDDVLQRFIEVLDRAQAEDFVRLTADCPLADPDVIDEAIQMFLESKCDYVSNTLVRTYPRGLDVEVTKSKVLRDVAEKNFDQMSREHVTYGIYTQPEVYSLGNLAQSRSQEKHRWTVDNVEDMHFVKNVYQYFLPKNIDFSQQDILNWLNESPEFAHYESPES
jgi:spore coat polysaccharide biosynthesis protein SpsF